MDTKKYNAHLTGSYLDEWDAENECRGETFKKDFLLEDISFDFDTREEFEAEAAKLIGTHNFRDIAPCEDDHEDSVYVSYLCDKNGVPSPNPDSLCDWVFHIRRNLKEGEVVEMFG